MGIILILFMEAGRPTCPLWVGQFPGRDPDLNKWGKETGWQKALIPLCFLFVETM